MLDTNNNFQTVTQDNLSAIIDRTFDSLSTTVGLLIPETRLVQPWQDPPVDPRGYFCQYQLSSRAVLKQRMIVLNAALTEYEHLYRQPHPRDNEWANLEDAAAAACDRLLPTKFHGINLDMAANNENTGMLYAVRNIASGGSNLTLVSEALKPFFEEPCL